MISGSTTKKAITTAMVIIISLLSAGCGDKVVSVTSNKIGQIKGTNSCSTGPGFCAECGLNLSGGYDCFPKMKASCTGTQEALFDVIIITRTHESGNVSTIERKQFVKELSKCR